METKKVIEQDIFRDLVIIETENSYLLTYIISGDQLIIPVAKSSSTEVAKAIDPKYQELEERYAKLLEALKNLYNANPNDGTWNYQAAMGQAYRLIQQSETKSKDNE